MLNQVQATVGLLEEATQRQPRHPWRLAMGGQNFLPVSKIPELARASRWAQIQTSIEQMCKIRQFAAPDFVRRAVGDAVQRLMPRKIIVQELHLRAGTLAGHMAGMQGRNTHEVVRTSLADFAVSILENDNQVNALASTKVIVRAIFTAAEAMGSTEILSELDEQIEKIPDDNWEHHVIRTSLARLRVRMDYIFGTNLPECPITLEPIAKENVRILRCCTAVIDAQSLSQLRGKCPLCRARINFAGGVVGVGPSNEEEAKKAMEELEKAKNPEPVREGKGKESDKAKGKRPAGKDKRKGKVQRERGQARISFKGKEWSESEDSDEEKAVPDAPLVDGRDLTPEEIEEQFGDRITELSRNPRYTIEGVTDAMRAMIDLKPTARILLCFAFDSSHQSFVDQLMRGVRNDLPTSVVYDVGKMARKHNVLGADGACADYKNVTRCPRPHILIINTASRRESGLQGLDLSTTDLTILAANLTPANARQAVGRSLRMQPRPESMADEELFPGKYILKACIPTNDALRAFGENMPALPQLHRPGAVLDQMDMEEENYDDDDDDDDEELGPYPYWGDAPRPVELRPAVMVWDEVLQGYIPADGPAVAQAPAAPALPAVAAAPERGLESESDDEDLRRAIAENNAINGFDQ